MEHIENNSEKSTRVWNACGYVRLSREDGDTGESNSVTGQKDLIRDYFSRHPQLRECGMRVDDGFSGSSFERPAFQAMMADVKAGKIDCMSDGKLMETQTANYFSDIYPIDCAVLSANA